ncbi:MAG: glycoside hydrolase family 2 protein [Candidatus Helarchaeota archaeon]
MPRNIIKLNGSDWKFQSFKDGVGVGTIFATPAYDYSNWMPATVPGNVRLDLMQNGLIDDPWYGTNNQDSQWVNKFEWWYQKEFHLSLEDCQNKIIHLVCKAIDYHAEFWLNGTRLGEHEGMFGQFKFDVTAIVQEQNILLIKLTALQNFTNRFKVIKCQMSYGWDWAPKMIPSGIWDDIYIDIKEKIYLESVFIRATTITEKRATIKLSCHIINQTTNDSVELNLTTKGYNFDSIPFIKKTTHPLSKVAELIEVNFELNEPKLWFPWDQGEPNLYTLTLSVSKDEIQFDEYHGTYGLRQFNLISQNIDPDFYPWIFEINGIREYIRGGNWVPSDMLFGQLNEERYRKNIQLLKEANINLVRVWGGGLIEKDIFYKICDEEGILVWQEFPIACVFTNTLPKDAKYLAVLKTESESIVKTLRNHPSLLLWCGGNEFHSVSNKHVVELLKTVVKELDTRTFLPASPEGGDSHNYSVFHGMGTYKLYLEDNAPMASEFGLSSFPNYSTLKKYIPEDELYFWSSTINYRAPHVIFFQGHKLRNQRYAIPFSPTDDLSSIIKATQQAQGVGLKTAIEHYRRRKWQNAGCAFWQINSPWPCISWCIFEYDYEKKLSYYYVRTAFQPVLLSLKYDLELNFNKTNKHNRLKNLHFEAKVFLINDLSKNFTNCQLKITFLSQENAILDTFDRVLDVPANTCIQLEPLSYDLPENLGEPPKIRITLLSQNKMLSKNFYNLKYYDPIQSKRMGRLMKRSSDLLMYGKSSRLTRLLKTGGIALCIIPLFIHLFFKTKRKWKRRNKNEFEYESITFLQE